MIPPGLRIALFFLCVLPLGFLLAEAPVIPVPAATSTARNWTTSDGHSFQATLVNVQGTQILLRLSTGQLATFPLLRLALADQVFVKNSLPAAPLAPGATPGPKLSTVVPPEKRVWPTKVEVDSRAIEIKTVSESAPDRKYVYRSRVFEFTSEDKLAGSVMKEIARTFEATHALVQALPWGIDPKPPEDLGFYQAKFYVDREGYIAAGGPVNSGGVYFSSDRVFRIPFPSLGLEMRGKTWFKDAKNYKNDVIVHEITHQMMHDYIQFLPIWAIEGMAEYDRIIPYNAGVFHVDEHERGLKECIKEAQEHNIGAGALGSAMELLNMTTEAWHQRADNGGTEQHKLYFKSCMLVYYFSHLDGDGKGTRFLKYLDKIREAKEAWETFFKNPRVKMDADGRFSYPSDLPLPSQKRKDEYGIGQITVLLDGRDEAQMQKDIQDGFKKIGVHW